MLETESILRLIITLILLPVWIGLCFIVPYAAGKAFNRLLLKGKSFLGLSLFFTFIAAISFLFIFIFILGSSIMDFLGISDPRLLFEELFFTAIVANAIGVICSLVVGFFYGKRKPE